MFFYILRFVKSELIIMTQVWDKDKICRIYDRNQTHHLPNTGWALYRMGTYY